MSHTSFSSFLYEGTAPSHPGLAAKLDDIRTYRGNESTADNEIAILRIGDTADSALFTAYLDWLQENLRAIDLPRFPNSRHVALLEILGAHQDFSVTPQAKLRLDRLIATLKTPS